MAPKKKSKPKRSKLMVRCCCLTLQAGAFLVAACTVALTVASLFHSLVNLRRGSNGNGERQMFWALRMALRHMSYRMARRAQESYERICTHGLTNFENITEDREEEKRYRRWADGADSLLGAGNDAESITTYLQAAATADVARGAAPGAGRVRRRYDHTTMEYTCVLNAEENKRMAYVYYSSPVARIDGDMFHRVNDFYRYVDIINIIISSVFVILAIVLIVGVVLSNHWLLLVWLATFPFFAIYETAYLYLRAVLVLQMYLEFSGVSNYLFYIFLLFYIPIVCFKYYVVFCYYWFIFTPAHMRVEELNNMQLIVSRRG